MQNKEIVSQSEWEMMIAKVLAVIEHVQKELSPLPIDEAKKELLVEDVKSYPCLSKKTEFYYNLIEGIFSTSGNEEQMTLAEKYVNGISNTGMSKNKIFHTIANNMFSIDEKIYAIAKEVISNNINKKNVDANSNLTTILPCTITVPNNIREQQSITQSSLSSNSISVDTNNKFMAPLPYPNEKKRKATDSETSDHDATRVRLLEMENAKLKPENAQLNQKIFELTRINMDRLDLINRLKNPQFSQQETLPQLVLPTSQRHHFFNTNHSPIDIDDNSQSAENCPEVEIDGCIK
jgi:hypothetical protein